MSSKQIAKLVFKGISFGANRIPDSWFEKVPGGYYKQKEEDIKNFERSRGYSTPSSTRAKKQARRRARRAYSNDVTDSESDWSSSEDYLTDDSERRPSRHHRNSSRRYHGSRSLDRDRAYRHNRAQSMPTTPPLGPYPTAAQYGPPQPPMQPQYPPQQPYYSPQQPQYPPQQPQQPPQSQPQGDFPAQRPYNPADYAMIPADGTTVQDPYAYHTARAAPDDYSTSNWVNTGHPASPAMGAAVPPQNMPGDPRAMSPPMMPYATPPYGSAGSYEFPPQTNAIGYSPQASLNGAPISRSMSAREPRSRSRRDKHVRMKSNSPLNERLQKYDGEAKESKKKKFGTPALGAVTGGLVASEVGQVGGLGTLAGAAIGGVALHLYERRRSKSRARESPAPRNGSPDDPAVHYENQRAIDHQMRQEKRRRRREEREAYGREQDGYQSY